MKKRNNRILDFDDSNPPVNDFTPERIHQIEKVAMPLLNDMLDKLRQEQPHLFKSSKK